MTFGSYRTIENSVPDHPEHVGAGLSYQVSLVQAVLRPSHRPVQRARHLVLGVEHAVVSKQSQVKVSPVGGEAELQGVLGEPVLAGH